MHLTFRSRGARTDVRRIAGGRRSVGVDGLPNRSSWLIAAAVVVLFATSGASASAAVTGLQRVDADSPSSSTTFRAVTATCPAGKRVLGGGAELFGGESQVSLNDVIPNGALTTVTAEAFEDQTGYSGSWSLRAYAICATAPPGLERVLATSPTDSTNKTVSANCPAGKRLLGAGGGVSGGAGQVMAQDIRLDSLTRVTSQGVEDQDGTPVNWQLRAYAICSNPVHLLERVVATSPSDSLKGKGVTATCPHGKDTLGAGGEVGGVAGQVAMNDLRPSDPLDSVTAHASEDEDGTASNWFVRAYAICAAVSHRVVDASLTDSADLKVARAICGFGAGEQVTGGGGDITGGSGQARLQAITGTPGMAGVDFTATGIEDENGFGGAWLVRSYAICVTSLPGRESVNALSGPDSTSPKTATVSCPAGKRVLGAGGAPSTTTSPEGLPEVVLDDVMPNAALTSVTATAYEDETGYAGDWTLGVQAICATPPPGLERVSAASPVNSDAGKSVIATCPSDKNLLGTGAEIDGGLGQVVLDDLTPNAALTSVTVTGREDETGHAGAWSVRSYAICASP